MKKICLIFLSTLLIFTPLFCQEADSSAESKQITFLDETGIFRLSPLTDTLILTTGTTVYALDFILDKKGYNHTDYQTYNFDLSFVPNLDRALMHEYSKTLSTASLIPALAVALSPALFVTQPKKQWITIAAIYAESLLWAEALKETAKTFIIRPRPYMYYDLQNAPEKSLTDFDWENSFFSGHTTLAFTAASFTNYLFFQFNPDSKYRFAVLGTSLGLAATTGVLRILSGNHFLSDVICGAIAGGLTGVLVPYFHTAPFWKSSKKLQVSLVPNGIYLTAKL